METISDEECREIVRKLRFQLNCMRVIDGQYAKDALPVERGNMTYRSIAWSVFESGNRIHGNYCDVLEKLIELIDRPTCKNLATKPADELFCGKCDEHVEIVCMESTNDYHAQYCPTCGTEIYDED